MSDKYLVLTAEPSGEHHQETNVGNLCKMGLDNNVKKRGISGPVVWPNKGAG
jgi:hypothetical protein